MTLDCPVCADRGIVRVNWEDAPPDFAICVCGTGLSLRVDRNYTHVTAPLWHLWCAREGISQERVFLLEDVLTPDELTARGIPAAEPSDETRETALLRAGLSRKPRL